MEILSPTTTFLNTYNFLNDCTIMPRAPHFLMKSHQETRMSFSFLFFYGFLMKGSQPMNSHVSFFCQPKKNINLTDQSKNIHQSKISRQRWEGNIFTRKRGKDLNRYHESNFLPQIVGI